MKIIEKPIFPFQENDFFSPIREKADYARVILIAARNFLIQFDVSDIECKSKVKLFVDKMSRLFFFSQGKYFSIAFPFTVLTDEDNEIVDEILTLNGDIVDNRSISSALSILNDLNFKLNPSLTDYYIESDIVESIGISLLEVIFQSEPGYIRYDNDPLHENGTMHPLNHLDINYSSYGTCKIGLNATITDKEFENILNTKTACSYLI